MVACQAAGFGGIAMTNWERLAASSGAIFVILLLITQFGFGSPPSGGQPLVDFYRQHHDTALVRQFLSALGGAFFLLFAGVLRAALRRDEGDTGWASTAALAAAVTTTALAFGQTIVIYSLVYGTPSDPAIAEAVQNIATVTGRFLSLPLTVFLAASSFVILSRRALPAWTGWLGLLAAALNLLSSLRIFIDLGGPVSTAALASLALWLLVVSVLMTARSGAGSGSAV
jgi:hypothetical protein